MLTTVQDLGRRGYQGLGVPVSGPMDAYSHRLANQILGNDPMAAALEITLLGPELVADGDVTCAVAGAEIEFTVDGVAAPRYQPFQLPSGSRIRCGGRGKGTRATLAVRGGFDLPLTLGSRATHLVSRMGPFGGRALRAGDVLSVGSTGSMGSSGSGTPHPLDLPDGGARVRVVPAAHRERFKDEAWDLLRRTRFIVSPQSNRMGYRLEGPRLGAPDREMISDATPMGAVQVLPNGEALLLMADRQTVGGYPKIAVLISADLPKAAQLCPGHRVRFQAVSLEEAHQALVQEQARLRLDLLERS